MSCAVNGSIMDGLTASYRTRYVFSNFIDAYEHCFSKNPIEKMPCWQIMALISEAVREAFTGQKREEKFDGDCRKEKDTKFVEEIRDIIKKKIENELTNIWQVQQGQTNKKVSADIKTSKEEKTFNDKVADAEKQYQEFKKENVSVVLPFYFRHNYVFWHIPILYLANQHPPTPEPYCFRLVLV